MGYLKAILNNHYPLLGILLGSALVSLSLGPYSNWDTQIEFVAASGVIEWGFPYITFGNLINQPPVGFYIDALFFKGFGLFYETGVAVITLFGLGCVFLVYQVGNVLYGKRTGLLAAALFGLTPWHVVLSRSFLIDAQCLFFSLLYLLAGIWAVRKGSLGLSFMSGTLFGIALLTKLFAVFMLIPLSFIYIYWKPKDLKRTLAGMGLFFLPAFLLYFLWYETISGLGLFSVFSHSDFAAFIPEETVPSSFFVLSFLVENPGLFFLLASAFSLLLSLWKSKFFAKLVSFDLICFATIVGVAGLNTYLALGLNMWVPYVNPIKYDYQILPAFCWLAASLPSKCQFLRSWMDSKSNRDRLVFSIALIGLTFLATSMIANMLVLWAFVSKDYLLFKVDKVVGYSFEKLAPIAGSNYLATIQVLGFVLILFSLLWVNKDKLPFRQ